MKKILGCLLIVLSISITSANASESPSLCIKEIQYALDSRDIDLFEKRANIDAIVKQSVTFFVNYLRQADKNQTPLPPMLSMLALSLNSQMGDSLQSILSAEAADFIRFGIREGYLTGHAKNRSNTDGILATIFSAISTGRKTITMKGSARMEEDETCHVDATLHDEGNGETYPILLRLKKVNGLWQADAIENLQQLGKILIQESKEAEYSI